MMTRRSFTRWRIAIETTLLVVAILLARLVIYKLSLDFIDLSPLFTSIVGGAIFVIGLLVAGTLSDYKESEKVPAELTAALDNIQSDCAAIAQTTAQFDLPLLRRRLVEIVSSFRSDLADTKARTCLTAVEQLSPSFLELEALDVPANYIVRLRNEQGTIRRIVLRVYHVQRTEFLPSAEVLIKTIVGLIIAVVLFTKIHPLQESLVVLAFLSYFFIYLLRLVRIIDTPFRVDEHTMDDVSLFLLNEFAKRTTETL